VFITHVYLLTRRTEGQNLETFYKKCAFGNGGTFWSEK